MPRDRRVRRERQTELAQAGVGRGRRTHAGIDHRQEAVEQQRIHLVAAELGADGAADQLLAATEDYQRHAVGRLAAEQLLLGLATRQDQTAELPGVESLAVARQTLAHGE